MEYRTLGNTELKVSAVCLGTMTFGQQNDEGEAHSQLDYALERGINFIDTAEMYPVPARAETFTRTESIVGSWLGKQPRDRIVLATKIAGPRRSMEWIRGGPEALDRANIRAAVEGSLARLQTDYIDLYQLHWPERNVPMFGGDQFDPAEETDALPIRDQLEVLAELVEEGKIRYLGLSNETPWGVMSFLRLAEEHGLPRAVSIQNAYNLLNRTYEYGLAEITYRESISLLAYSPLGFGYLSGKYLPGAGGQGRATLFKPFTQRYQKPGVEPAVSAYVELARQQGISPVQLALSYVYRRWFVTSTIIGATTMEQLSEDIDAWELPLPEAVHKEIEVLHRRFTNPAP